MIRTVLSCCTSQHAMLSCIRPVTITHLRDRPLFPPRSHEHVTSQEAPEENCFWLGPSLVLIGNREVSLKKQYMAQIRGKRQQDNDLLALRTSDSGPRRFPGTVEQPEQCRRMSPRITWRFRLPSIRLVLLHSCVTTCAWWRVKVKSGCSPARSVLHRPKPNQSTVNLPRPRSELRANWR